MKRTAIIGGGAAGFFLAISLKEMQPDVEVTIFEKSKQVLAKVKVSGGGRCNCTNSFAAVSDLSQVYPRGHRLLKRLFKVFGPNEAYAWFERHGVQLVIQDDNCVFPASQDSQTIIDCFLQEAHHHGITIRTNHKIETLTQLRDYDFIAITTGGMQTTTSLFTQQPILITPPVPSLFTFRIDDQALHDLMGTVVGKTAVAIPGTKFRASGPLLITHWGISGPAILGLSSYAARELAMHNYQLPLAVNWTTLKDQDIMKELDIIISRHPQKQLSTVRPFNLPGRLWSHLVVKALGLRANAPWKSLNQKELNRLVNILSNDTYQIAGRAPFKDEFVTCGGVDLSAVSPQTLESKDLPHVYFAGEVLDIDGITGGFNFQAAWTTAYTVAKAISYSISC